MYRPHLNDTCCPPYTIRLDACAFAPTKSQRKVEKRWRQYLDGELDDDGKRVAVDDGDEDDSKRADEPSASSASFESTANPSGDREKTHLEKTRDADATPKTKRLTKRVFEIREAPSAFDEEEYRLWRRYQASVHGDDEGSLGKSSYRRFLVDTPLRLRQAPVREPEDDEEQGGWVEWAGYAATKQKHKENDAGENDAAPRTVRAPSNGFGSFHHQYRVDGRLVAVGVVDVLPKCLSSKYFFWEPSFAWASLGKLGALREIEWVKNASKTCASLRYYYLGYYIHECPKMRYKAEYRPSELKCAVTGKWTTLDDPDVLRRLEGGSFAPLRAPEAAGDDDGAEPKKKDAEKTSRLGEDEVNAKREEDVVSVARDVLVGMAAGGQILQVAPFSLARQGPLGGPAGAALARRIETWRRATGDAGDAIVYLVDLERVAPEVVADGGESGGASDESASDASDASDASSEGAMGAS
jgi:arginine-tRNA-protein transferase